VYQSLLKFIVRRVPALKQLDDTMKDVMRRTSTAMILRFSRTLISFVFNVILARMLGADGVGVYFLAYTVTRIASIIGRVGLDQAVLRYVAAGSSQGQLNQIVGVYRYAVLITSTLSVLATAIVFLSAPLFGQLFNEPSLVEPLRIMSFSIFPWALIFIQSRALQGMERIGDSIFIEMLGIPFVNIPLVLVMTAGYGLIGAAGSYVISTFLILLLGVLLWRKITPDLRGVEGEFDLKLLMTTSMPLFWVDFTIIVMGMTDTLILGVLATSTDVGIYDTAKRVSALAGAMLSPINMVVAPKFAGMYAKGEIQKLGRLARNSAKFVTVISIPYLVLFMLVPEWILSVFGSDFAEGAPALMVLALSGFVNAFTGSVGFILVMTGNEKLMRNNAIATSIFKIILQLSLIPFLGFLGAAIATAIADATRNLISVYLVYRQFGIITIPIPDRLAKRFSKAAPASATSSQSTETAEEIS